MMKNVLHDFDDAQALALLRSCRRSMDAGARLLVIEMLAEPGSANEVSAFCDLQMMTVCCGGRQRGRRELEALLTKAGFQLSRVAPTSTLMSIIEAVAVQTR